ncbi:MAG TPA: NUDIX hydrolase [Chthoniobacteraceae bacterium]|jgi:ADP-ribose pyrophosphatase YjhB (NUDIX family)|nr:NUDIX hydrolase [Chthoniobacteraceae bacterium]
MPIPSSSASPQAIPPDLPKFSREVSVMAWIEDAYGNFLMVRQAQGKKLWTLPGGKVKATETLEAGLFREIEEEIGGQVRTAYPTAIFDRPEKRNLTVLYRVSLIRQRFRIGNTREIATIEFKARRPTRSSPSAIYFCRLRERFGLGWR